MHQTPSHRAELPNANYQAYQAFPRTDAAVFGVHSFTNRNCIRAARNNPVAFHTLTVILFLGGVGCVAWIGKGNWLAGAVWGGVVGGGVGIGCPLGLIWLQKYKKYEFLKNMLMLVKFMVRGT